MGLHSLPIEATIGSINAFLQHYGTETALGLYLRASLENLQLELGVSSCPLEYDYEKWGSLATNSWVKALWERIHRYKIKIDIDYESLPMPRERDECIMERFMREKVPEKELVAINRVRKQQQALFLSDIVTANGQTIERQYLSSWHLSYERQLGRRRSHLDFGLEWPS